ncbi:MAG TPA: hypothetical protein PK867_11305 [Pirellulales bacterium]|nr:hypothetical protein [Pirellulales bacterium]
MGTSFLLFSLLFGVGKARGIGPVPFVRTYLRFLGLYWMTAPLAWLYAVPVENFMTPLQATVTNLALLGLVSVWRVWLMTRVVQCLFSAGVFAAWPVVLFFADAVALAAMAVTPVPVISIMGGISHTDAEIAVLNVTLLVGFACVVSLPIWVLSTAGIAAGGERWEFALTGTRETASPTRGLRWLAVGFVAAWILVLPMTQPRQRLARHVDDNLKTGKIKEAVAEMAAHNRGDFPARWDAPPHVGYGEREPPILDVMEVIVAMDPPPWVRSIFTEKFGNTLYNTTLLWPGRMDDKEFSRYVQVLLKLHEGPSFAAREARWLRMARDQPNQSEARQAGIDALLDLAKSYDPERHPPEQFARPF